MFDADTIKEFVKQGAGFALALIMFIVWYMERKKAVEDYRLIAVERKDDRDKILKMMGRIEVHLDKADSFEVFARESVDSLVRPSPKRRILDRRLAQAIAKVKDPTHTVESEIVEDDAR